MKPLFGAALLAAGARGCEVPSESMLRVRAAYDLNWAGDCTWVMNSDVRRVSTDSE